MSEVQKELSWMHEKRGHVRENCPSNHGDNGSKDTKRILEMDPKMMHEETFFPPTPKLTKLIDEVSIICLILEQVSTNAVFI